MSKRYLVANWKMNVPPEGMAEYVDAVAAVPAESVTLVIAPPAIFLPQVVELVGDRNVGVGAQNCSDQPSGAFTGEISATMFRSEGARYAILGHSERRSLFGEHDALIARKLAAAIGAGLAPVLCVGE